MIDFRQRNVSLFTFLPIVINDKSVEQANFVKHLETTISSELSWIANTINLEES